MTRREWVATAASLALVAVGAVASWWLRDQVLASSLPSWVKVVLLSG